MSFDRLRSRLSSGRPLVVDADTGASFRARGVMLDSPGALGQLLRETPGEVLDHYRAEIGSRVDVLSALTADTTPRALAEVGMEHRAAMLTSLAVELALEAAAECDRAVAVAGVLGSEQVSPIAVDRLAQEFREHAARLEYSGCELILAQGQGSELELLAAVEAAASTGLPTWAVLECLPNGEPASGGSTARLLGKLADAGAGVILFEVASVAIGVSLMTGVARNSVFGTNPHRPNIVQGVLLSASSDSVRGFPNPEIEVEDWVHGALGLEASGYRVIGGGAGTTEAHTAALARALGALHPSIPSPAAASAPDTSDSAR